jgi:hypothetical protein
VMADGEVRDGAGAFEAEHARADAADREGDAGEVGAGVGGVEGVCAPPGLGAGGVGTLPEERRSY